MCVGVCVWRVGDVMEGVDEGSVYVSIVSEKILATK